jgi:hypothetical protein
MDIYHYVEPVVSFFVKDPKPRNVIAVLPSSTTVQMAPQHIATNLQYNIKKTLRTKFIFF